MIKKNNAQSEPAFADSGAESQSTTEAHMGAEPESRGASRSTAESDPHTQARPTAEPDSPTSESTLTREQDDAEDADAVIQAIDELADRAQEIERLKEELATTQDQFKRQVAEFQNYRRRTEQEKAQMVTFGKALVVQKILDIVDDFSRSLEATERAEAEAENPLSPAYQSLKSGVELVYQKFTDELTKLGVEPIEAVGKPFDEEVHEALMQQEAPDGSEPGVVLSEVQRGYRMGDRVLRHARVVVSN